MITKRFALTSFELAGVRHQLIGRSDLYAHDTGQRAEQVLYPGPFGEIQWVICQKNQSGIAELTCLRYGAGNRLLEEHHQPTSSAGNDERILYRVLEGLGAVHAISHYVNRRIWTFTAPKAQDQFCTLLDGRVSELTLVGIADRNQEEVAGYLDVSIERRLTDFPQKMAALSLLPGQLYLYLLNSSGKDEPRSHEQIVFQCLASEEVLHGGTVGKPRTRMIESD